MTYKYFDIVFGSSGDLVAVPDAVQPDGSVSYTQGYGVLYSTAVGSGGINIERGKMNQLFYDITTALNQLQTFGIVPWIAALAASPGYSQYALVRYSDGIVYQSQVNTNASTPGTNTDWQALPLGNFSGFTTGDAKITFKTSADTGWILANDGTIGNAASGGTTRANADTAALFSLLWTNTTNANCAVSGGRGGSAAADFAANKTIAIPKALGRALALAGSGSGLTARALAFAVGEEAHALTSGENGTHTHTVTDPGHAHSLWSSNGGLNASTVEGLSAAGAWQVAGGINNGGSQSYVATAPVGGNAYVSTDTTGITNANSGSGTAHNTMQPTAFVNFMIKL